MTDDAPDPEHPPLSRAVPFVRARALLDRSWDAIVIGSGVGGLVCAALLATRASLRVLVLERHYEPGGLTQSFRRRRFTFDVGVHYVGDLGRGAMLRRVLDASSGGRLRWASLPAEHDRVQSDEDDLRFGGDLAAWRAQLARACPGEQRAIDHVLAEIHACARAVPQHFMMRMRPDSSDARGPLWQWSDRTTREVLDRAGASERLASLLAYTWGNYGAPPERSSFAAHAMATAHYFGGAFYPVGGGGRIAREIVHTIAGAGGAVVVRADVASILVAGERARGVVLRDGREVRAPLVISDAGAWATFDQLLDDGVPHRTELREQVRTIGPSDGHVALYLGLSRSPSELGLDGANRWITPGPTRLRTEGEATRWALGERALPPSLFVSTGCANDPSYPDRAPGRAALGCILALPWDAFAEWARTTRGRRGGEYESRKDALGRSMLALLRQHVPSIEGAIEHVEVSTPLSTRDFAGHAHGEACGLDPTPRRFRLAPRPATPVPGLFLTGQDVWMSGVGGAAFGGLLTACAITRRDLARELVGA